MDEDNIEASLQVYKAQLDQVSVALEAGGQSDQNLIQLKSDLTELVKLTEDSLLAVKKAKLLALLEPQPSSSSSGSGQNDTMDTEMAAFMAEINKDKQPAVASTSETVTIDDNLKELEDKLQELEGTKCRVPYTQEWGTLEYHNAMILSAEPIDMDTGEIKVRVFFCHPTHKSMLPCPYYLDGNCKFSDSDCRFSHGYTISIGELQEYKEHDYDLLHKGNCCLAKYKDDIWYKAGIKSIDTEQHKVLVEYTSYHETKTLDYSEVIPIEDIERNGESDDDDDDERLTCINDVETSSDDEDGLPVYLCRPIQTTQQLGEWEAHTKGIGSKLMLQMGYIMGQGLGKMNEGRAEPVPIQLLPPGKSLDKIMELKEKAGDRNLMDVMKKNRKKKIKIDKKLAADYKKPEKKSVFDFINKKLHGRKGNIHDLLPKSATRGKVTQTAKDISAKDLKSRSDKQINLQLFKTQEEMKNVRKEMERIKESIKRNEKNGDSLVANQNRTKLQSLQKYLEKLQSSELSMELHKKSRNDNKKLTIF